LGREPDEGISIRSKAARRHFRLRLKHLDSKRQRIHPRRPSIKKRANYRTNQIDAIGPTEVKKNGPANQEQKMVDLDGRISGISFRRQGTGYALPPLRVFQLLEFCAMLAL